MKRWRTVSLLLTALVVTPLVAGFAGVVAFAFGWVPLGGGAEGGEATAPLRRFLEAPGVGDSIVLSLSTGLLSTAISLALTALLIAAGFGTRALDVVERAAGPILAVPHAAAALGLVFLLAPSGFVLRLISPSLTGFAAPPDIITLRDPYGVSLTLALVLKETPFLVLMALAALRQVRASVRAEVARSLGYGRMAAVLYGVWPLIHRQLRLPVLAVLAFGVSVVDMALILGPTAPPTLGVRILEWRQSANLADWSIGAVGALVMIGLVASAAALWHLGDLAVGRLWQHVATSGWRLRTLDAFRPAIVGVAGVGAAVFFLGLAGLLVQSVALYWPFPDVWPQGFSVAAWQRAETFAALTRTLAVAVGATALALPVAIALLEASRRGVRVSAVVYLPLVVPQVAFLFGLNVAMLIFGFAGGIGAVTVAHSLFAMPYVLVALSGPWAALDPHYERAAMALGASPWRSFFLVRLAMLSPALLVAAALSVAVSVGLYLPTQLIGAGQVETVTTEAVAAAMGGDRRSAGVFATLQLVLPTLAFALARAAPRLVFAERKGMRFDHAVSPTQ